MRPNFLQSIVGRSFAAESITTVQKIRFKYRFHDQKRCHLHHAISYRRNAQRPQLPICLLDPYTTHRLRPVSFLLQRLLDLTQKSRYSAFALLDALHRDAVNSGRALIRPHPFPCRFQYVAPKDSVIQRIEPKLRFPLRFLVQPLSQLSEFLRQAHLWPDFRDLQLPFRLSRSGIFIQAAHSSSYSCTLTFSPFAPRSLPVSPLLWAVRLPQKKLRVSQVPDPSFLTRRPLTPRRVRWLLRPLLHHRCQASSDLEDWPLSSLNF